MTIKILSPLVMSLAVAGASSQPDPSAKAMFYDPGDLGSVKAARPTQGLRPIMFARPFYRSGIHYWLETADGARVTEGVARGMKDRFTLHIRNNLGCCFLTVWDISGIGRQLTPMDDTVSGGGGGLRMSEEVYVVPGAFEFTSGESPTHLILVWARSQSEVAHSIERARARPREMAAWGLVREVEEATPGEIGTYVVNRRDGGVFAEIVFRSSPVAMEPATTEVQNNGHRAPSTEHEAPSTKHQAPSTRSRHRVKGVRSRADAGSGASSCDCRGMAGVHGRPADGR